MFEVEVFVQLRFNFFVFDLVPYVSMSLPLFSLSPLRGLSMLSSLSLSFLSMAKYVALKESLCALEGHTEYVPRRYQLYKPR